jgi:GMP synthase (glutamine-hydrolysing)
MNNFVNDEIQKIKTIVKNDQVVCGLSGGVDSAVTAAILAKAIGKNLTCLFVDHGLLRKNEANEVVSTFKNQFKVNFIKVDASKLFLNELKGVIDPEQKRKIIGKLFIEIFEKQISKIKNLK